MPRSFFLYAPVLLNQLRMRGARGGLVQGYAMHN